MRGRNQISHWARRGDRPRNPARGKEGGGGDLTLSYPPGSNVPTQKKRKKEKKGRFPSPKERNNNNRILLKERDAKAGVREFPRRRGKKGRNTLLFFNRKGKKKRRLPALALEARGGENSTAYLG